MIELIRFQSPIGLLSILAVEEGVIKISLSNESTKEIEKWCQNHFGIGITEGTHLTSNAYSQILNYLSARRKSLDFPVVHINSTFRKSVLEVEKKIPYGQTRSYREVAQMIDNPKAFRAVGSANAENPLPLYYPCHRIIYSNGRLGGYSGGKKAKQYLLNLEKNSLNIHYNLHSSQL